MEEWKNGRMEEWKNGRMEEWKNGRIIYKYSHEIVK
jgi:hypothetical protein